MRKSVLPRTQTYTVFSFNCKRLTDRPFDGWHDVALLTIVGYMDGIDQESILMSLLKESKASKINCTNYEENHWHVSYEVSINGIWMYASSTKFRIESGLWTPRNNFLRYFVDDHDNKLESFFNRHEIHN